MGNLPKVPNLGQFFGDLEGPSTGIQADTAQKVCPYLDQQVGEFCTLDEAMCPYVGFNYRRCKKYIANIAKGADRPNFNVIAKSGKNPPRLESLTEAANKPAKKGGSAPPDPSEEDKPGWVDAPKPPPELENLDNFLGAVAVELPGVGKIKDALSDQEAKGIAALAFGNDIIDVSGTTGDTYDTQQVRKEAARLKKLYAAYNKRVLDSGVEGHLQRDKMAVAKAFLDVFHETVTDVKDAQSAQDRNAALTGVPVDDMIAHVTGDHESHAGTPTAVSLEDPDFTPIPRGMSPQQWAGLKKMRQSRQNVTKRGKLRKKVGTAKGSKRTPGKPMIGAQEFGYVPKPGKPVKKKPKKKTPLVVPGVAGRTAWAGYVPHTQAAPKTSPTPDDNADGVQKSTAPRYGYQTRSKMNLAQFNSWMAQHIMTLTPDERLEAFPGAKDHGQVSAVLRKMKDTAAGLDATKNYTDIADMAHKFQSHIDKLQEIERGKRLFQAEWAANLEKLKASNMIDQQTLNLAMKEFHDPQRLDKTAKMMNTVMQKAYRLNTKNVKIGNQTVTQLVREATFPVFTRADYEVMQMSENMGLKAIQKQHQYGRAYGKWNTWMLLAKQVFAPFILWYTGHPEYIKPLLSVWPQAPLDALFFSYVQKPLPVLRGSDAPQLSRDSRFLASKRMATGRSKRIMKGYHREAPLPPDRAVLHSRSYPTTNQTWGKIKTKELTKRYQKAKAGMTDNSSWTQGFLRR